ncbi:MAG: ABC transporter ATP-binding protein [Deltaproteobacteria bacterium]|nr:ABC transporter ATP-binding protein [Deltaproteobacteria bacterium]
MLRLVDLSKRYGSVEALQSIDLQLKKGKVGLLGPNGAGKSTLFKILLGLVAPSRGQVEVLGFDAAARPLALRERVGYMPERDSLVPGLDAVELCTFAGELCGLPPAEARERANSVLSYVGLDDKRYLKVTTYSTGQKQRVKLAQAIVHDPELLLLDEPTNGLDPRGRDEMLALIAQLPERRGCSIILSSHLLPDVEAVCEDIVVLDAGRLRYTGPMAELRGANSGGYEVEVKADPEKLAVLLRAKGCEVSREGQRLGVWLPDGADTSLILREATTGALQIRHLAPRRVSLETAFLEVLKKGEAA